MRRTSTLMIRDRTRECGDGRVTINPRDQLRYLVIHRISLTALGIDDRDLDVVTMCKAFQDPRKVGGYTGNQNPYALLVRNPEGFIEQATPLLERGAHAAAWNPQTIGIAIAGDFRNKRPDPRQWHRAVLLAAAISQAFSVGVVGHDELPGGSRDRDKRCPGRYWPMILFRSEIKDLIAHNGGDLGTKAAAMSLLARSGAVLGG